MITEYTNQIQINAIYDTSLPYDLVIDHAHGSIVYDKDGKELKSENVGYEGIKVASYRDGTAVLADMKLAYYEYGDGN